MSSGVNESSEEEAKMTEREKPHCSRKLSGPTPLVKDGTQSNYPASFKIRKYDCSAVNG